MIDCKNCSEAFEGNYCPNCGQSATIGRINLATLLKESSQSIFQIDRGFFHTLQQLMIRPGEVIIAYLEGRRKHYFKPITYVLILSTVYFLIQQLIEHETWITEIINGFLSYDAGTPVAFPAVVDWLVTNFAYTNLLLIPIFSLASYLSFLGYKRNYLEHVVLNAFITGQQVIFYLIFSILLTLSEGIFFEVMPVALSVTYLFWVYWVFFKQNRRFFVILRTLLTYCIYFLISSLLLMLAAEPIG